MQEQEETLNTLRQAEILKRVSCQILFDTQEVKITVPNTLSSGFKRDISLSFSKELLEDNLLHEVNLFGFHFKF